MIKEKIVNKRLDSSVLIKPQNDVISVAPCHVILSAISVKDSAFLLIFIFCPNIKFSAYFLQKSLKQLSTFNFQLNSLILPNPITFSHNMPTSLQNLILYKTHENMLMAWLKHD